MDKKERWFLRCGACNGKALEFMERPVGGMPIEAKSIRWMSGQQAKPGDPIKCSNCGAHLRHDDFHTRHIIIETES